MAENASSEYTFKICVLGDRYTGKTSILKQYIHSRFTGNYKPTIGVDFASKLIEWGENGEKLVNLHFWDIMGQDTSPTISNLFLRGISGLIIVFDVTDLKTLANSVVWKEKVDRFLDCTIPIIICGNKVDLLNYPLDNRHLDEFCSSNNIDKWFQTSAKTGYNIADAIESLIDPMIAIKMEEKREDAEFRKKLELEKAVATLVADYAKHYWDVNKMY